jgi:hypothetical protein
MITDGWGVAAPNATGIIEIADEFFFLAIDADPRLTQSFKALFHFGNILELLVAVWVLRSGDDLSIRFQREVQVFQQSRDGSWASRDFLTFEFPTSFAGALARPLERTHRITSGLVGHQTFQNF